jgi:hypothetical protein
MRILMMSACALAAAGCAVLRPVEEFSEAALFTDDAAYVALRYQPATMAQELSADLVGAGYLCSANPRGGDVCTRTSPSRPGCAYEWNVRINAPRVEAVREERCTGAVSPP